MPRAQRRRIENRTTVASGLDAGTDLLAKVIGESVALHLAGLLGQLLPQMPWQPVCLPCAARAWRAAKDWEVAARNAAAAAEPPPEKPDMTAGQSFTAGLRGPVCWSCFDPELDGPMDFAGLMPAATD